MAKLTLNTIGSRYGSIDALNDNFDAIEAAIENTLSLDGTSPNAMEADLDMNSNSILNAATIHASSLVIGGQTLEPGSSVAVATVQVFEFTATAGQTSFSVSPLTPASSSVLMEVNGLSLPTSSLVTSGSTLSFPALTLGDEVVVKVFTRAVGSSPVITNADVATSAAIVSSKLAFTQAGTGAQVRTVQDKLRDVVSIKDFGAVCDGVTDDLSAVTSAISAASSLKLPVLISGTVYLSNTLSITSKTIILGAGYTSDNGTRGRTCFLRGFTGSAPTLLISGNDVQISDVDVDNNNQGTGPGIQVKNERFTGKNISVRKSGGIGIYVGDAEATAPTFNANLWSLQNLYLLHNVSHGLYVNHTNTSTDGTFPLGNPDVNAGSLVFADIRSNGGDGIRLGNCIDNTFVSIACQSNTGTAIKLTTSARGNYFYKPYIESNGAGITLDAGANANIVHGSSSIITGNDVVDNGTDNLVLSRIASVGTTKISQNNLNLALLSSGNGPKIAFYSDTGADNTVNLQALKEGGTGGKLNIAVKEDGNVPRTVLSIGNKGSLHIFAPICTLNAASTLSSATTITPVGAISFVSGTTTISTITVPSQMTAGGSLTLIPTGLWATNTAGNISLATTAVVGKALTLWYDSVTNKWYPSY